MSTNPKIVDGISALTDGLSMVAALARSAKLALMHPEQRMHDGDLAAVLEGIEIVADLNLDAGLGLLREIEMPELRELIDNPGGAYFAAQRASGQRHRARSGAIPHTSAA